MTSQVPWDLKILNPSAKKFCMGLEIHDFPNPMGLFDSKCLCHCLCSPTHSAMIARFMGSTWGPPVGPRWALWPLLSGQYSQCWLPVFHKYHFWCISVCLQSSTLLRHPATVVIYPAGHLARVRGGRFIPTENWYNSIVTWSIFSRIIIMDIHSSHMFSMCSNSDLYFTFLIALLYTVSWYCMLMDLLLQCVSFCL